MSTRKKTKSSELELDEEEAVRAAEVSVDEKLDELAEKLREGMGPHEFEKLFSQVWTEESRPESIRLSVASGSGSSGRRGSVRS
jgi:hypothetical protein